MQEIIWYCPCGKEVKRTAIESDGWKKPIEYLALCEECATLEKPSEKKRDR